MKTQALFYSLICSLLFALVPSKSSAANTYDWVGGASGHATQWSWPANWKIGASVASQAPGASSSDIVNIGSSVAYSTNQPTISSGTVSIAALNLASSSTAPTLTLSSGVTLNVSGAISVYGGSSAITTTINGGGTLNGATLALSLVNNTNTALVVNTPVNISTTATTGYGATATITIGSTYTLKITGILTTGDNSSVFTVTGAGTLATGGLKFGYQGSFTIGSSGVTGTTVTLSAGTTLSMPQNNNTLVNWGTLTFAAGCAWNAIMGSPTITNNGTMNLNGTAAAWGGNTLVFTNSSTAFCYLTNSASLAIGGAPGASPCFSNAGTFSAISCALNFTSGSANTISNTGVFYASASPIAFGAGSWTVNNSGTFSALAGSSIYMPANTSTLNGTAGTFTVTGSDITFVGTTGTGIKNSGTSVFSISNSTVSLPQNGVIQQTSSGSFTINGGSTVTLATLASITNSGNFYAGTSDGTTASTCTININTKQAVLTNSTTSGKFFLGPCSVINLGGDLANITNTSPGTFTLQSDGTGSAAIGVVFSTATTTGTFSVERYYQGGSTISGGRYVYRGYRLISSPVHNSAQYHSNNVYGLNYIVGTGNAGQTTSVTSLTNAFVTGATGGNTSSGNPSLYLYRESIVPNNSGFTSGNFIGITDITNSSGTGVITTSDGVTTSDIPVGNGVLFFDRGPATSWTNRTKSPYLSPDPVTLTTTGLLNTQSVSVKDWYNTTTATGSTTLGYTGTLTGPTTNEAVRGFNLVGNPYACSIDWNTSFSGTGITRVNVNPTIWVFNPRTNQYDTYITTSATTGTSHGGPTDGTGNATNIIASGQGFFVQAATSAATLTFTENAKVPTMQVTGNSLLMGTPLTQSIAQRLKLALVTDSINYDDIIIGFRSTASPKFDQSEDARYIPGSGAAEGLSSFSDEGVKLAINYLPLPKLTAQSVKLFVTAAASGTYTFKKTALDGVPAIYDVWLMDKYKKDSLNLRNNTSYAFNIDLLDTATYGNERFEVVIRQNPALAVHLLQFTAAKSADGSQVTWKTENEVNYTNFTVERSNDNGTTFNVIGGFISNQQGGYSFLDSYPATGANQYRLKLEDLNGAITYSNIVTLMYQNTGSNIVINNIKIYPNPAVNTINLAITPPTGTAPVTNNLSAMQSTGTMLSLAAAPAPASSTSYGIKIINISGDVIKSATSPSASWQDNVSTLTPGTYIITVVNNSNKKVVGKSTFVKL